MVPYHIQLQHVKQGMITVEDVFSPSGQLVVEKNTMLNQRLISRMKLYNIKGLYVLIPENVANEINSNTIEEVNPTKTTAEFKVFRRGYEGIAGELEEACHKMIHLPNAHHDFSGLVQSVMGLAGKVQNTMHLMDTLQCLREYSDTVYIHSISVALISLMVASKLHLSQEKQELLVLSALFHDIGKLHIPADILNKPSKLTDQEYEIVKRHPQMSYDILVRAKMPQEVLMAALLHHERQDGSGYPSHLKGDKIPLIAKIIAIADVYDAMTARRSYRKEICSFDVIAEFEDSGYQKYDATLLLPFLESIAQSHINAKVRLSNSLIGTIVMINQHKLSKPVINVDGTFRDLSKEKDISIIGLV